MQDPKGVDGAQLAECLPGMPLVSSAHWEADAGPSETQGQPRGLETLSYKKKIPLKHSQASLRLSCPKVSVPLLVNGL